MPTQSNFFIGNDGNVGIGTLTPGAKLDVQQVPSAQGNALGAAKWMQIGTRRRSRAASGGSTAASSRR